MERTQIYLTEEERPLWPIMTARARRSQSDLVREAVDGFIARYQEGNRRELLRGARGTWKGRTDLPDFRALRKDFDKR